MAAPEMHVLYDVSALGPVAEQHFNLTGVQRVVHEVAGGLAARAEVDLQLYAAGSLSECERFVSRDAALRQSPFVHTDGQRRQSPRVRALVARSNTDLADRSLRRRAERWTAQRVAVWLRRRQSHLSARQLQRFDVFHTPVHAFPASVRRVRELAKFLTVYDLTPIKMPEHSHAGILREYRAMLASVPEDAWILCISENTKRDWCEFTGTDPNRCFVTPLAAARNFAPCQDAARIDAVRRRYGIPEGDYFLSVSTLEPRKNLAAVIQAFRKLLSETKDKSLYLVLVGKRGWREEGIFKAAAGAEGRSQIIFTGYVAEDDLSAIYSGALAFLYLSLYEGFGLPPLEAMQCGVPVVTSNNSSLPEVVGSAGIMLDPRDRDGLGEVMLRLRADPTLRAQLRDRSLTRARRFSWGLCVDRTINAYRTALAAR